MAVARLTGAPFSISFLISPTFSVACESTESSAAEAASTAHVMKFIANETTEGRRSRRGQDGVVDGRRSRRLAEKETTTDDDWRAHHTRRAVER